MANTFDACLGFTLRAEGGWADDPRDPGGCTMRGITLVAYREWKLNPSLTCADLYKISDGEIHQFYHDKFWLPSHAAMLPVGVDLMVMDAAVNMGTSRSVKILQQQLGAIADGMVGPATINAANGADPQQLVDSLAQAQAAFYRSLENFPIYGTGWLNRVDARHTAAASMMSMS